MTSSRSIRSFAAFAVALSLSTNSLASVAPAASGTLNPLVALSVFGSAQSRAAVCAAGSAAAAAAATTTAAQGQSGCVLPVMDAPPPVATAEVPPTVAPVAPYVAQAAAPNLLPLLAGLGLLGGVFFLLDNAFIGDSSEFDFEPPPVVSPT